MSDSTIPVPKLASETPPAPHRPLSELLPSGGRLTVVVLAGIALAAVSIGDFGLSGRALIGVILCPVLVLLAAIDVEHHVLPNVIVLPASLAVGLVVAASAPSSFLSHLAAAAALGGFFFAFAAFLPGSIGMGDAKLGFLLGLALASRTLGAMMIAFAGLLVAALWVLARRGMSARKDTLPFGPFLALGGVLGFFFG
jgi:leader peptidase (prepilin peptidase) / N-methyltransferase